MLIDSQTGGGPTMTVVIPTYNRPLWVIATIKDVIEQRARFLKEIIVVDQSEAIPDAQAQIMSGYARENGIRWIRSKVPHPSHARNHALLLASSDIILFLDDDVILRPDLLHRHYSYYVTNGQEKVIGVTGQLHTRRNHVKPEIVTLANFRDFTDPIQPLVPLQIAPPSCHPILVSANASVWRPTILGIGGFDENLCFNEDRDVTFRLHATSEGHLVYDPEAWIIHLRAPSGGCRTVGTRPRPEVDRQLPSLLFLVRHFRVLDARWRLQMMKDSFRCGPLRRENLLRFWRQPMAWACFARAVYRSLHEKGRVRSSINKNSYYPEQSQ